MTFAAEVHREIAAAAHGIVGIEALRLKCRNISDGMNNTLLPLGLTPLRSMVASCASL
jgi:hypothetical protein